MLVTKLECRIHHGCAFICSNEEPELCDFTPVSYGKVPIL
jgi:hypothetical protein